MVPRNGRAIRRTARPVAVGTRVTPRPPHRSVRAAFPHTVPTLGIHGNYMLPYGPSLALDTDGQSRDIPASDAILLRVMWPSTPAGRQCLA